MTKELKENKVPNLDAMDEFELSEFYDRHEKGKNHLELFPECTYDNVGLAILVTGDLALYALHKYTAMKYRKEGQVNKALDYENFCDIMYTTTLPKEVKW